MEPAAAIFARRSRRGTALAHVGSVVVLAVGSAYASPEPAAGPQAAGPYIAARPEAFEGRVVGAGYCVDALPFAPSSFTFSSTASMTIVR